MSNFWGPLLILELTLKTEKSEFRDEDENRRIARTDALMYALHYSDNKNSIITTSTRAQRVAKDLEIFRPLLINPVILLSYLEMEVSNNIGYSDISSVLFNPFLNYAIHNGWEDIKKVVELGGDLRGTRVTRLKRDLKEISEKFIYSGGSEELTESDVSVVRGLMQKDYIFKGRVNDLMAEINSAKIENDELKAELQKYKEKEAKKNKYLKRHNKMK